jgi:homoprotocatechuate degradation regulator HpaR
MKTPARPPYRLSLAGTLLAAREAVMSPIRPVLRDAGLTEQQWRVLRVLVDQGDTDASGLAQAGILHAPSVTRILKDLIDRGLVVRTPDAEDGRRSIIAATDQGRLLLEATAQKTSVILQGYADSFGPERLAALQFELRELSELLEPFNPAAEDPRPS